MQQIDLILEPRDTRNLHPQLGVKLHGALMHAIPHTLADAFHEMSLRPYSMFVAERDDCIAMRVSVLSDEARAILDALLRAESFPVSGLRAPLKILERTERPALRLRDLLNMPPLRDFRVELASPAIYRQNNAYRNMFSLESLLLSTAEKLEKYEARRIDKARVKTVAEGLRYRNFTLHGAAYEIKHSVSLPACAGKLEATIGGAPDEAADLSLLLRYATYAGWGARTALGMGGILLTPLLDPERRTTRV
jgi:CRISPR/Cas system endoribonuclease Cas6 (RAMP superfamily)